MKKPAQALWQDCIPGTVLAAPDNVLYHVIRQCRVHGRGWVPVVPNVNRVVRNSRCVQYRVHEVQLNVRILQPARDGRRWRTPDQHVKSDAGIVLPEQFR